MVNKKIGNKFEREFAEILAENGYWVHLLNQNASGQPADLVAINNEHSLIIDCKVCTKDYFPLSRLEDNQRYAHQLVFEKVGIYAYRVAIKMRNRIYLIPFHVLLWYEKKGHRRVTEQDLIDNHFEVGDIFL